METPMPQSEAERLCLKVDKAQPLPLPTAMTDHWK